jgi:hypothetical protein
LVFTACDSTQIDQGILDEPVSQAVDEQSNNDTDKDLLETERKIGSFLLQGEVLSTSYIVCSGYTELYFFSEQGTYAYLGGRYGEHEECQFLSQRFRGLFTGNMRVLYVNEE